MFLTFATKNHFRPVMIFVVLITFAALSFLKVYRSEANSGSPAPQQGVSDITFSNNTLVDFSATSGEPYIKVDGQDNIFVSTPFGLSTTVSLLWKSIDGGRSFIPLGTPVIRDAVAGLGGGDTHQDFDANNWLYYVDLSGACVTAAVSTDGGNTFPLERVNHLACFSDQTPQGAVDDRQWVAGFGNGIGYVTFRNLAGSSFYLFKTTDGGLTWDKGRVLGAVSQTGPLVIDKQKRRVTVDGQEREAIILYQIFYTGTNLRVFRVMDFGDGAPLKIDNLSIANPGVSIDNVFPVLAVDNAGNPYAVWSQTATAIWMASSADRGSSWSAPVRVSALSGTNIMPWIVAGDPGRVDIIWYRTALAGNPASPTSLWDIYMAQSLNALSASAAFTPAIKVSQNTIHKGQICLDGLDCDTAVPMRDRSFLEFPSISVDSKGAAVIVFNDNTNQVEGPYVVVSKQVTGPSLYASVGTLRGAPGTASVSLPSPGQTITTTSFTAEGAHTIPGKNFDKDESGDARFPDHGQLIGQNIPALDIRTVSISDDPGTVSVTIKVADLGSGALASAARDAGGDGLLYLTQFDVNDSIYWLGAELRAGQWRYLTGTVGLIRSGTSKKFVTYNPDAASSMQVQGTVNNAAGTITMKVPRGLVGNPVGGTRLFATGYGMSERGPLVPIAATAPNPSSFPVQVDASGAFTYILGEQPQLDGVIEISLDDASFATPRVAAPAGVAVENRWQFQLTLADLTGGQHTLYARQRINGRDPSPLASVQFSVPDTAEQTVTSMVSTQASNFGFTSGVAAFDLTVKNTSQQSIYTPISVQVASISSATGVVTVANSDNGMPGAGALFDYTGQAGPDGILSPNESAGPRRLRFGDATGEPFTVTFNVTGRLLRIAAGAGISSAGLAGAKSKRSKGQSDTANLVFRITYNPLLNTSTLQLTQP
jgi:hypothetical protein